MSHDLARPARRVLIVDDHAPVAMCFRLYLDQLPNCEVVTALSGAEALRLFAVSPFGVLVTDRMMPGMNGVVLAERVRQLYPGTVMIMVTAFIDALADPQARDLFERILVKPVEMEVLCAVVLEALDGAAGPESAQATVDGGVGASETSIRTSAILSESRSEREQRGQFDREKGTLQRGI